MASIQERSLMSRMPLDKWTISEQLCLASAVASSGDQNWMSVSRALKIFCGSSKISYQSRPADWFSQKNCAVQYAYLSKDVETPKRQNRLSETSASPSPVTVGTSTDSILTRLTDERIQEIKTELRKEQEEYAKLYSEIKSIQNGEISDDQLIQIWNELEKDQEMQRIEEMKLENQLRERELKKQELQRRWRTGTSSRSSSSNSSTNSLKSSTDTTAVDMDVEEIIGTGRAIIPVTNNNTVQLQTGTSPLLSSLLKSPNSNAPAGNITVSSPPVRNTAPTITILLTGGSIPNQNKPALIPSHDEAAQLLTRPISGPPLDTASTQTSVAQTLLSPSQSAPTLSMLLEKNKTNAQNSSDGKKTDVTLTNPKVIENENFNDSNNESVPMDIEEDLTSTKFVSNPGVQSGEIDDTDPNEEQQLLEVFKNIGNIEELDIDVSDVIDEEVDFLKGVDEDSPLNENIDIEQKLDVNFTTLANDTQILPNKTTPAGTNSEEVEKSQTEENTEINNSEIEVTKIEIISSDDSNDNIPLAAVASLESSKDRLNMNESSNEETFLKDQVESANTKNELDQEETANESSDNSVAIKQEMLEENEKFIADTTEASNEPNKHLSNIEQEDVVFVAPTVEDTKHEILKIEKEEVKEENHELIKIETKKENEVNVDSTNFVETESNEQQSSNATVLNSQSDASEILAMPKIQPPPSVSIVDTDENSSSTDISVQTRKDDKHIGRGLRKSPHETKTDDEMPNPPIQQMVTPNVSSISGNLTPRPTVLRKLRDRDRSESPMIDDDATTHSDHSTTNQRYRRRYSSTPIIDSIPNSPASSDRDERDLRTSKKSLLSIYNVLYSCKYSAALQRVISDDPSAQKLEEVCLRSIDFLTIKRNIESGLIRSVHELQRDMLWMCQNALMITKSSSASFKTILHFQQECQNIREFMANGCEPCNRIERDIRDIKSTNSSSKGRSGSRKSLRLS